MPPDKNNIVIEVMPDGPLLVKGLKTWQNSKGEALPIKDKIALCRCGASANKPYCDGSHAVIGFSGERNIDKPLHKERQYQGEDITIHDNRVICSHAAECVNKLPAVFRLGERPWIEPNGADVEAIIAVIEECPSGALSYTRNGVRYRDQEREPAIKIAKNGPYDVTGGIAIKVDAELQPPSREHYSLCRCGASKNKPFCDGSHHDTHFRDDNN